jgi:anti-anti-sigma factor
VSGVYRHITAVTEQGVFVLTVDLTEVKDYMIAEELRYELVHAVKRANTKKFVLDLHNMEFMTSLACVSFIGLKHGVREVEGRLVLCHMTDFIRKVFNAKRLLTPAVNTGNVAFEEAPTLADAINRLLEETTS